jgi:hypothetical protein
VSVLLQQSDQAVPIYRLGEVIRRAQRVTQALVVHDGEHYDGNIRKGRISFQRCQHRPAIHPRHEHVQGDDGRMQLLGQV